MKKLLITKFKMLEELIDRFQSPKTAFGKNLRDGVLFSLGAGVVAFLQSFDAIDFGETYNPLISLLVGWAVPAINRITRK